MADEELLADGEIEAEGEEPQADPVASLASELGWTPKDEWRGDPEKWRPADEFIRAGRDIQQTTSRELKSLREQMSRFGQVAETLVNDKAAERDAYWKAQHREAVETGDVEAAEKASEQLHKANGAGQAPAPEAQAWVAKNAWFNADPLAADRAREIAERLARQGYGVAAQLDAAERTVRREFPEHFPAPAKQPPATQTGGGRVAAPSNRAKGFADMPAESQQVAKDMVRRHPDLKVEDIARQYWANREKVG